jgi:hypothetical protein
MAVSSTRRGSPRLALVGVGFLLFGCFLLRKDYIAVDLGAFHRAFTRDRDPLIYWGLDLAVIGSGIALLIIASRRRINR